MPFALNYIIKYCTINLLHAVNIFVNVIEYFPNNINCANYHKVAIYLF